MGNEPKEIESLRQRKRRETLGRIAETGLRLFTENGYDQTTLEEIAAASGISARTFFYYFKTKDEVLQLWQGSGFVEALGPAMSAESTDQTPFQAVQSCLLKLISRYDTPVSIAIDRILNSSETLRARKPAYYLATEQVLFDALCQLWPRPEQRKALRMVAMISIGAMRLAMEARRNDTSPRPLALYLRESFAVLKGLI